VCKIRIGKEVTFDEFFGNGCALNLYQRPVVALTQEMNVVGHQMMKEPIIFGDGL